jgi:Astacin (Peptidase family M12A)
MGTPAHEIIHALGYDHMHNDEKRDNFVKIELDNVEASMRHNFDKVDPKLFGSFNTAYDYRSVMHYDRKSFSTNGLDTIVPLDPAFLDIIGKNQFGDADATRLKNMYQCA